MRTRVERVLFAQSRRTPLERRADETAIDVRACRHIRIINGFVYGAVILAGLDLLEAYRCISTISAS